MEYLMEAKIDLLDNEGGNKSITINKIKFHKMIFLFNALEDGWTIKKKNNSYYLLKNHEGKKEIFLDSYLSRFMKEQMDINKILY
jgi:hypothetical protein